MSASRKRQSPHSRTRCTSIYATQDTTPACFCFPGYSMVIKNTVNTVEAGYPGIPRSINMGIRVRLCSDWCLREADDSSDYPQTSVSCIVRTQYPYFAQRYAGITGFGSILVLLLNFYTVHVYTLWYSTRFISSNVSCVIALPYVIIRSGTGDFPLEMGG